MTLTQWNAQARIKVHHRRESWEWQGTLTDCLNIWLRLTAAARRDADIFVQSPIQGKTAIGPGLIESLIAQPDFQRKADSDE
jgi:hypothetical protein